MAFVYIGECSDIYIRGYIRRPGGNFVVYVGKRGLFDFSSKNQKEDAPLRRLRGATAVCVGERVETGRKGLKCRGGRAVRIPRGS